MFRRILRSALALAALAMAAGAHAVVPCTLPVDAGESVASCFGGLLFPLPPNPPYVEDPNGYVVGVIDTRLPPLLTNPVPVNDVNWPAEMFKNMGGLPQHQWTAANLGQVFGLTLDSAPAPNIYVAATTLYGNFTVGPGGPGAVYRLDGVTGDICLVLQLPNGGPALGQLTHDPVSNHLFISNFEDGLIYSVSLTPVNGSACSLGNWTTYDHGVQGRPDEGLAPIPDAGSLNTFTDLGRRVWGVCVYQNRLYYSVWWEDFGRPNTVDQNEIWSVQIDSSGNMLAGTAVREAIIPDYPFNTWACPVSDIEFTEGGGMLIAERTIGGDKGKLDLGQRVSHSSRILKYVGASGSFTMLPQDTYRTGKYNIGTNSAGGVTSDCEEDVWAMVDAIHFGSFTGDSDFVYGPQKIDVLGNATDATATINSAIIGLGPSVQNGAAKNELGDLDYLRDCRIIGEGEGQPEGEPEGEGQPEGEGEGHPEGEGQSEGERDCLEVSNDHADCVSDATGQSITYTFDLTNLSGVDAYWALFTSQTPGVTITPNQVATFIPNGGTLNFTLTITGATPGKPICFTITLLDKTREVCCSQTICIENPCDCVVIPIDSQKIACDPATPGAYTYTFSITNTSPFTLEHAYLFPDGGGAFSPNYFTLGGLAPGGTAGPFTVTLSGVQPGDYCFTITLHDRELKECCAFRHCIELPNCCDPDTVGPVITVNGPTSVQCGQPGAYEVTAIDDCDGDVSQTIKREGQVNWFANGTYCVTLTASDSNGNVTVLVFCVTVTGCDGAAGIAPHAADQNMDDEVQLGELLRVIQFYNAGGLHCEPFTEDGYAPGLVEPLEDGIHHTSDYLVKNWQIELSELLRLIQFYNAQGYHVCVDGEDGFCIGKK